jgi:hypothetical protein
MNTFVLLRSMNRVGSKFHLVLNTKDGWYVVAIVLTKIRHICISVPRVMAKFVQFGLQQKQLGRTSVTEFFGHDNVGIGPQVEYQC